MKKRTYRTKKINDFDWQSFREKVAGRKISFAIDVAKEGQFACLSLPELSLSELIKWKHPLETPLLLECLASLNCPVTVIMESTSTYGDALRYHFRQRGFDIHQANTKRVHDAREVYDGVPSMHDAKAATIISRHYWENLTKPWQEPTGQQRQLNALCIEYEIHRSQYEANRNRLEAYLSRHWPELGAILTLSSVSLEQLLIRFGSPQQVAAHLQEAEALLIQISHGMLKPDKIRRVLDSAQKTLGVPCIEAECQLMQAIAQELMRNRLQQSTTKKALEDMIRQEAELVHMAKLVGAPTTGILISLNLDPRSYDCPASYRKGMGLNLKEKSSGQVNSPLKITKRGSGKARLYLFYATLRLVQTCSVAKEWYKRKKKANPNAPFKAIVAVMRKLAVALWHVGRGNAYDPLKLFTVSGKPA